MSESESIGPSPSLSPSRSASPSQPIGDLERRIENIENVLTNNKPIYINSNGHWEEFDLWEFDPISGPGGNLEERVAYLENLLRTQKPIYINVNGHFQQIYLQP